MKVKYNLLLRFSVILSAGLLIASLSKADSILQSAGDFALLGGTAITVTVVPGTTIMNGNVGLSPAAESSITGFPPAVISDGAIINTGATTNQARVDLMKAQSALKLMPTDMNLTGKVLGQPTANSLAPGVYKFNAAAALDGNLILDGKGKNNAYWVFQIGTTLTTTQYSTVTIVNPGPNGGKDYGIFWNCGSAIDVGKDNEIAGIYMAETTITFGTNSTRGGRALALAAIILDNNQFDAKGGPGGGDWSGGLAFDAEGNIVPVPEVNDEVQAPLSFSYTGRKRRVIDRSKLMIRGIASTTAMSVQYRLNKNKWRSVPVLSNHTWSAKMKPLLIGNSRVMFRALDAAGAQTAIQRLTIRRVLN